MGLTLLTLDCSTSTSARAAQCSPCRQPDPDELQRITESIWWYRDEGNHSAEALRLGKQTLCQLSYSRSEHALYSRSRFGWDKVRTPTFDPDIAVTLSDSSGTNTSATRPGPVRSARSGPGRSAGT